jgi:hypothetical protein
LGGYTLFINQPVKLPIELQAKIISYLAPQTYCEEDKERLTIIEAQSWLVAKRRILTTFGARRMPASGFIPAGSLLAFLNTTPYNGRLIDINTRKCIKQLARHPSGLGEIWRSMQAHDQKCKCDHHFQHYRHDHSQVAPQMLVLDKQHNETFTKFYFEQGIFFAVIIFSGLFRERYKEDSDEEESDDEDVFLNSGPLRAYAREHNYPKLPAKPVMRWHQVDIIPGKSYPLSFDSVRVLDLHINVTHINMHHFPQYLKGLRKFAKIFAPDQAPAGLQKLVLKVKVENGVYRRIGGVVGHHISPGNIVYTIKWMISPFYVFSGEGNGTVKSIREEGESELQGIDLNMETRYQLAKRNGNSLIKKTVEVDVFIDPLDGIDEDDEDE